ncbi:MAG: hypothetical protein V4792_16140 [Pseudomonadota bacterium]
MASAFDSFLQRAWSDHADQAEAVARRLRTETPAPESAEQLAALVRLVVHLCGEHLGAFDDARWRLAALACHPLADAGVQSALRVGSSGLSLAETGSAQRGDFSLEELVRSEASAAAVSLGRRNTARAMSLLSAARRRLAALPAADACVHRPLAVACNNMAWELHDRGAERSAGDTAAMLELAAASRLHWFRAGTWLEVERADYCLALCHLSAGSPQAGLGFATECLATCQQNSAPVNEHFFAHEALGRLQHALSDRVAWALSVAAAQAAFDKLTQQDQDACRGALDALKALAP